MIYIRNAELAYKDAIFISTHKFIGGPQTPGILVAKKKLFKNAVPHGKMNFLNLFWFSFI